jgi:quercetin dioxygenase-like cupin family protein
MLMDHAALSDAIKASQSEWISFSTCAASETVRPTLSRNSAVYIQLYKAIKETHMQQQTIDLHVNPSEEVIRLGPLTVHFLITAENSNGSVAAFEVTVPGGQRLAAPAHSHDHYEETIYGVDGVLTWTVDGKQIEVGPGQALCIPRGAVQRFDNHGMQDAKALCVITPAAISPQYFRESAEVINAAGGGPPDRTKMVEIMRRHGLTPAPPPRQA